MNNTKLLKYKNYFGSVDIDTENNFLFGKVEFIRALITYEAEDVASLVRAFHQAVDDYLELCRKKNIQPEQPFKGSLNIRIGEERHRKAALAAAKLDKSLNDYICQALDLNFETREREKLVDVRRAASKKRSAEKRKSI